MKTPHARSNYVSRYKEFSAAHQPGRATKENIVPFLANGLNAARRVDFHRRLRASCGNRRHCDRTRTGSRRKSFSSATLEENCLYIMLQIILRTRGCRNELDVDTVREVRAALNFGSLRLPVCRKFAHEYHEVRIPDGNPGSRHRSVAQLHRQFFFDDRWAHLHFEFEFAIGVFGQSADFRSRSSENRNALFG